MNKNISNIIQEFNKINEIKVQSSQELKDKGFKIQKISQLLFSYFIDEVHQLLAGTVFLQNFKEINLKIKNMVIEDENTILNKIKKKHYSPEDLVTLLDPDLTGDLKIIAIIMCSYLDNYVKLNTYLTDESDLT